MTKHSLLPPSSASRRVACPGSRALEASLSNEPTTATREGEAAHWLAAWLLTSHEGDAEPTIAENGETLTEEMWEGAELYRTVIFNKINSSDRLHIEETIDISTIHPECFGTPDCWVFDGVVLSIWDYKFGHSYVEVFENWQLIEYAAGIIDRLQIVDGDVLVYLNIVQPRAYSRLGSVHRWQTSVDELQPYFDKLRQSEAVSMLAHAPCSPSPECTNCKARAVCPTLQRAALTACDVSLINTRLDLKPSELGNELRYLKRAATLLDARITGLEEQALAHLKKGERVPFCILETGKGRDRWVKDADEIITLGELLGYNLAKPREPITPLQALKKGIPAQVLKPYIEHMQGSTKLIIYENDKARKIFSNSY